MHGCASGYLTLVNAGVDSMGGVIDGGVEISSAPSPHQSSDLEKTQAQLRETFTTAEKFRKELEFLQKGGDPLDLKVGNAASVSLQSTSLTDQHPEQFVTSEVKTITASPHGDSVESSGRLGEPNSADNLMLFDGNNNNNNNNNNKSVSVALELPEKSYKRRIRSRPNRRLVVQSHTADNHDHNNHFSNSNSTLKSPNLGSNTRLDIKSNGTQETPLSMSPVEPVEQERLSGVDAQTVDDMAVLGQSQTKGIDSKSCLDDGNNNKNEVLTCIRNVDSNGSMEVDIASKEGQSMEGNDVITVNNDKTLSINNNEIGPTVKEEEGLKGDESALVDDLKKSVCSTGVGSDGCTTSDIEKKPLDTEENVCSENNMKLAIKEHEDSILEEARIIEEKRKRIAAGLSVGMLKPQSNNHRSHWQFVLEEMSWLANDFAQERLWKVTAAAQISQRAAYSSHVRFQQQKSLWKQKEVAHTLTQAVMEFWHNVQVKCKELESNKDSMKGIDQYGMRFLEYNSSKVQYNNSAQAPVTPDRISDLPITDISWEDNLTEENLFYIVPPGAIEAYRKTIESHLLQSERTGSSMQEEVDANGYDDVADNNTLEEDEGETSTYYLPGAFEGSRMLSKTTQKKRKHGQQPPFKSYVSRPYETGADSSFPQPLERNNLGKRPGTSSINVSIPTKRVRTASRPRFTGPGYNNNNNSNNNINNNNQAPNRADASSGDTNSFQDEQTSLHNNNNNNNNNMEAESVGDYEKYDMTEVSNRPKKKKKGSTFDHRWQLDSSFQNDQKEHSKRRLDNRQFDSNGNSASQMSNMSNPNKFMKLLVRDRGRKAKSLKTPVGQQGPGSPWSLFEDQALVVLVHDLGANWELISDAINSTLQFQCISRNSKECKERHKFLMDKSSGDGADSAEDSGSSQPYPSTLPGIPEGSARQLLQRLQGPMQEDTLKSHFDKIIALSRKLHFRKSHKDNHDPKQLQQPHGSHTLALSQILPNNLNGGPVLTPLDLCEPVSTTPADFIPVGYQLPGSTSTSSSSSPAAASAIPSGPNPVFPSGPNPISPSVGNNVRDGRYGNVPDQQHRMQQYNQMLSARNMAPGPGPRMLGNGNGMGVMSAMNRGMMIRPPPPLNSNPTVRSRDPVHIIRNPDQQRQNMLPEATQGGSGMGSFPQQPPAVQPYPVSPHMPHHLPTNPQHPAFGMRMLKERQRLRQQQFAAATNPGMPRGQLQPTQQLPLPSSPQSGTTQQIQSQGPVSQHLQKPGLVRSPQSGGNLVRRQLQPPPGGRQQGLAGKVMKGGGVGRGTAPGGDPNGFVADHHLVQTGGGPSSPNPNPLIQKRFPGQPPQQKSKLVNQSQSQSQSQLTPAQKIILQNRKAANPSDLLTTKLQARGLGLTKPPSLASSDDVAPVSKKPEPLGGGGCDSSAKVESSGPPPVNNNHSSSDTLNPNSNNPNPNPNPGGVQQQWPSSS